MKLPLDFEDCLKDSPKFRSSLDEADQDIDQTEVSLTKAIRQCNLMVETGRSFTTAHSAFVTTLQETGAQFADDQLVEALGQLMSMLTEWQQFFTTLLDQYSKCFGQNLSCFVKNDIRKVKESRRKFQKSADDFDAALHHNAQTLRGRPVEDSSQSFIQTRHCFRQNALDHVLKVNLVQIKKRIEMLNSVSSCFEAHDVFTNQVHSSLVKPVHSRIVGQLNDLEMKAKLETDRFDETYKSLCNQAASQNSVNAVESLAAKSGYKMEGYLFKRTSNAFKSWVRRWFVLADNQLLYCSRQRSRSSTSLNQSSFTVLERDLRACRARPMNTETERRFCFQVSSPNRIHILQADSEQECQAWVAALQDDKVTSSRDSGVQSIFAVPGNNRCCDCGSRDPCWASISFGITLCIECCGVHRSFGVQKSKVRSMVLDDWEPEQIKIMTDLGNKVINDIYEANVDKNVVRASAQCDRLVRESWLRAKYIDRLFIRLSSTSDNQAIVATNPPSSPVECSPGRDPSLNSIVMKQVASQDSGLGGSTDTFIVGSALSDLRHGPCRPIDDTGVEHQECKQPVDNLLYDAAFRGSLPDIMLALALGADINYVNSQDGNKTPLIKAIESCSMVPVEFLLIHGAKTDICDLEGRGPLHYAAELKLAGQVCQLLKRNVKREVKDVHGLDALSIAVNNGDANIVTLLRIAQLHEEMKASDGLYDVDGDDTVSAVFQDISNSTVVKNPSSNDLTKITPL